MKLLLPLSALLARVLVNVGRYAIERVERVEAETNKPVIVLLAMPLAAAVAVAAAAAAALAIVQRLRGQRARRRRLCSRRLALLGRLLWQQPRTGT